MQEAIRLAHEGMRNGEGGPFGALVVKDGHVIGKGCNKVAAQSDPTAHAEIVAIREACRYLGHFQLEGCVLYTSCEPCPMCLGAIYWARPERFFYACTKTDAAAIGFDDKFIYEELEIPLGERKIPAEQLMREDALKVFQQWSALGNKFVF